MAHAHASATIVSLDLMDCEHLRMRTTANLHEWSSVELQNGRQIDATCTRVEAKGRPRLIVEYRNSNGSVVTVTLDNGAVSVAPRQDASLKAQVVRIPHVDRLDMFLNHD